MQARVKSRTHQHRVVDRGHRNALTRKDFRVIFHVLPDFQDRAILQHRAEHVQGLFGRHLAGRQSGAAKKVVAALFMAQGDVAGLTGFDAKRDTDQFGAHLIQTGGFGIHGDIAARIDPVEPKLQRLCAGHAFIGGMVEGQGCGGFHSVACLIGGRGQFGRRRGGDIQAVGHAAGEGPKLHLIEKAQKGFGLRFLYLKAFQREIQRCVAIQRHKAARDADLVGVVQQRLAAFGLLDFPRAGEKRFQIAVFLNKKGGGLDADPRCARHVIHRIPRKRLDIDHTVGADAEFLEHLLRADQLVLHRVEHAYAIADQLHKILVGGDDRDLPPRIARLAGQGCDDVIGLIAFGFNAGDVEGAGRVAGQGELRAQVFG